MQPSLFRHLLRCGGPDALRPEIRSVPAKAHYNVLVAEARVRLCECERHAAAYLDGHAGAHEHVHLVVLDGEALDAQRLELDLNGSRAKEVVLDYAFDFRVGVPLRVAVLRVDVFDDGARIALASVPADLLEDEPDVTEDVKYLVAFLRRQAASRFGRTRELERKP